MLCFAILYFRYRGLYVCYTMLDKADSNRPDRCSALITYELSRLNVDIAALSVIRFPDEGSLQEHGARYTLFW